MTDLTIANTIKFQLGVKALYMMGAKYFTGDYDSLSFKICASKKVSNIKIKLEGDDTYTMTFYKISKLKVKIIDIIKDVYFDNLLNLISIICEIDVKI